MKFYNNILNNTNEEDFKKELLESQIAFKENRQFDIWSFINKYSNTDKDSEVNLYCFQKRM